MATDEQKVIFSMVRVDKFHGPKQVLKDISIGFFYGAKIGVLGLNGSGKSTLLRVMAGQDEEIEGREIPFYRKVFGQTSDRIVSADFNKYKSEAAYYDGQIRYYERMGNLEKAEEVRTKHAAILNLKEDLDDIDRQQKDLQDRIDVLRDMPDSEQGRLELLNRLEMQMGLPYNVRQTGLDDLAVILDDVYATFEMNPKEVEAYSEALEKQRLQMLKQLNKRVRDEAGKPRRPRDQ